jgi:hypothetical protein
MRITDIFALVSIIEWRIVVIGKTNNPISTTMFETAWKYVMNLTWKTPSEHCPCRTLAAKCIGLPQLNRVYQAFAKLTKVERTMMEYAAYFWVCD